MDYLHVVIQTKNDSQSFCIFKDLSENELRKKFINPYKLGKKLFYSGRIMPVEELSKVIIVSTAKTLEQELDILLKKSNELIEESNNSYSGISIMLPIPCYPSHEIQQCGTQVTEKYINEAPGEGTFLSKSAELIKHPWIVRIFAGLSFMLILIYFGIK